MSDARIAERGYRSYDGPRLGVPGAVRSLMRHTARRVLGLRRNARTKVLPVASAGIAYIPAIVFVGITALLPDDDLRDLVLPSYGEYYGFITAAIIVFAAFVAPEALCQDRRSGMLGLYLASPLTRDTYLAAKAATITGLLAVSTLGPPLLMLIAFVLQGTGPDGPDDVALVFLRVAVTGIVLAAYFAALSMVAATFTDRRALASAAVILMLLLSGALTGVLVDALDAPEWVLVFNLAGAPFELANRLHGEAGDIPGVATWAWVAGAAAVIAGSAVLVRTRYQALTVVK